MFEYFSKPKIRPKYIDHNSFILCRPGKSYKVNANVCIIKDKFSILYDVGIDWHMLFQIEKVLKTINKKPKDLKLAIISHFHPDHILNAMSIRRFFPSCRLILHRKTYEFLTDFTQGLRERNLSSRNKILNYYWRIMEFLEGHYIIRRNRVFVCDDEDYIPGISLKLKLIHTPGHSSGHICLHDCTNKILFLGDHLPFTPWLDISENSIDNMISSIQKLLKISSKSVEYSVRGHGNLSDDSHEVYPWNEEKIRFKEHLDLIYETIEKIPALLRNQSLTIEEITSKVLKTKDYLEYSSLMNRIFMPPNITWVISYLLKLNKEGIITNKGKRWFTV